MHINVNLWFILQLPGKFHIIMAATNLSNKRSFHHDVQMNKRIVVQLHLIMCMFVWLDLSVIKSSAQFRPVTSTPNPNSKTPTISSYPTPNVNNVPTPVGMSPNFYSTSCPQVFNVIQNQLAPIIQNNPGQAAGILRIMFHDCFVQVFTINSHTTAGGMVIPRPFRI